MSDVQTIAGGLAAFVSIAGLAVMSDRVRHTLRPTGQHRATPPPAPVFTETEPGTRWLVCDTTRCAHLTTRHTPLADFKWQCTGCDHIKGD